MIIQDIIGFSGRNKLVIALMCLVLGAWGTWAMKNAPLDAIPDLSDPQVIIYTEWQGRSPDLVEDQVTYPIVTSLLAAPGVQSVRGFSFLGSSFIYVIFKEGTDIYWARSRVLEYLQSVRSKIPADVNPVLGPDATSLGWGFSYALVDKSGKLDLAQLRSLQDWNVKLALESVPGVSEVASLGGFVKQFQITVDPRRLFTYGLPLQKVLEAVRQSNNDVEGRVIEMSGAEYMVRGRGYVHGLADLENIAVGTDNRGTPIYLKDVARVSLGPEMRRGLADLNGQGEVTGGIVVVRFGENVLSVIDRVKAKIAEIEPSLPPGVTLEVTYDRSDLIHRAISTLTEEIIKLTIAVSAVCIVFLFHLPSALVIILTLPLAIIISFICMNALGVTSNIMSLSGIAIAIGAMVDAAIIMVENAHKKLEDWEHAGRPGSRSQVVLEAAQEVGPSLFFSLLVITVGFLPVFTLQGQAGRLFKPLAYTKTFAMLFSSFLAITLTPMLMTLFIRGKVRSEDKNPLSHVLRVLYHPFVLLALRFKKTLIFLAVIVMAATVWPVMHLGTEFMPPLYEGTLFYMPSTMPGIAISEAAKLLKLQDSIIASVPEVAQVFGKAGRAGTATDPAPMEMFETVINLKPESQWRPGMTVEKLKDDLDKRLNIPGTENAFTMPIKARVDMLSTGIRTPVGIKILGPDLAEIEKIGTRLEEVINKVPHTRSAFADKVNTGYYLDISVNRQAAARYGLSVADVEDVIESAIGGRNLTTVIQGRERYPVNVRYPRELRQDMDTIKAMLVPVGGEGEQPKPQMGLSGPRRLLQIPLGELANIKVTNGPSMIKSEGGMPTAYVYIDFSDTDVGSYVNSLKKAVAENVQLPAGYRLVWSGEYENLVSTQERLQLVIPLTIFIIFMLLYFNTKSFASTCIVLLAVPFSLVGSFWLLYLLGYNLSIAVWVGIIALAGLDAETGVVMLLYLQLAHKDWQDKGRLKTLADLNEAVEHGAVKRIRPKIMTVAVILAGLLPVMFATGAGSDVMKRIAAPMIGGVVTSTILELLLYPAIFALWKGRELRKAGPGAVSA
ncbi:efflux RND transporter permease subunit [Fundidesulfovibrio terrae]|uniref:efflux RND transporter permease subunit n=1 Tax=Fundidesulfovibrio terrae TaxID=2922866 RepID=UPI00243499E1|nr:CusA/CzcA family heavy metal efflux RND transporter [Fundidesulfovibrio terrae]